MILRMNGVFDKLYPVTSKFHEIDSAHPKMHLGVDIATPTGTDILSPDNGIVEHVLHGHGTLGEGIIVRLKDGKELIFGHLSEVDVKEGQLISLGQKIAESGNTGHSTGPHLHIALKDSSGHYIDPDHYAKMMTKLDDPSVWEKFTHLISTPFRNVSDEYHVMNESIKSAMDFFKPFRNFFLWCNKIVSDVKAHGFLPWLGDQFLSLFELIFKGILYFDELIFLFPAFIFLVAYFMVGRNKYTRMIVPLGFGYFVCEILKARL